MTSFRPPALPGTPGPRATGRGGRQRALVAAQVAAVLVVAARAPDAHRPRRRIGSRVDSPPRMSSSRSSTPPGTRRPRDTSCIGGSSTRSAAAGWPPRQRSPGTPRSANSPCPSRWRFRGPRCRSLGNAVSRDLLPHPRRRGAGGSGVTTDDHADAPLVAMVNRTLAERLWPRPPVPAQRRGPDRDRRGRRRPLLWAGGDGSAAGLPAPGPALLPPRPVARRFGRHPAARPRRAGRRRRRGDAERAPALLASLLALVTLVLTMGGVNGHSKFPHPRSSKIPPPLVEDMARWPVGAVGRPFCGLSESRGRWSASRCRLMPLLASQLYGITPP